MKAMQTNVCQSKINFDNIRMAINPSRSSEISTHYFWSQYAKLNLALAITLMGAMLIKPAKSSSSSLLRSGSASTDTADSVFDKSQETITFADKTLPILPRHEKRTGFGREFQVNTHTISAQQRASVSALNTGDFIVVWQSWYQDSDQYGIYGQRFSSTAIPQGSEFQVNTYTTTDQWHHSVSTLSSGDFVVVWDSNGQDGDGYGIYGQRFSSMAIPQGSEFQINTYTTNVQSYPSVVGISPGGFVVVWQSNGQDGDGYGIYAQRFSSTAILQGSEFQVNTYTTLNQQRPSVAALTTGDFVVVWESDGQADPNYGIYGQRYSSAGVSQGSEFQINTNPTNTWWQRRSSVVALSTGDFLVVWDSDSWDIYGQRFSNAGVPQGGEFQINTYTTSGQRNPSVAALSTGDFVVTWHSYQQDGDSAGIYGQRYSNIGIPQGSEFQINTYTTDYQGSPSVAGISTGDFVVVWESGDWATDGQDGDSEGVYGRIYFYNDMPPELTNNALTINEGATVILSMLNLNTYDPDNNNFSELTFIVSNVQHGQFEHISNAGVTILSFTQQDIIDGAIQFVHDGSKNQPSYDVSVSDGSFTDRPNSASITFVYIAQNQLVIQPGESLILGPKQLDIQAQLAPTDLEISVIGVQFGHFEKNDGSWKITNVFNLSELNAGDIRFVHDGTENKPQYILQLIDLSTNFTFPRQIMGDTILNHPPELTNPIGVISKKINEAFSYVLPNNIFTDPDNHILQISVKPLNSSALPAWIQFDNVTTTLNGKPVTVGSYAFKAVAIDPYDAIAEDRFYIDVKPTNSTTVIGNSINPFPIVTAIVGGATLLTAGIAAGFWYRKNNKDQQTRKQYPFADYIRSELKLEELDNFATSKGAQYVLAINQLAAVFKENYGVDIDRMDENELKQLAKQVALAAKSQITPKTIGIFQKSAITVSDLSDNVRTIAQTVQRLAGGFEDVRIVDNRADNNLGTLVEDGINTVRNIFSPKMELV